MSGERGEGVIGGGDYVLRTQLLSLFSVDTSKNNYFKALPLKYECLGAYNSNYLLVYCP